MMPCEFENMLSRYHDGELSETQRVRIESHLGSCANCTMELEQLQALAHTLQSAVLPKASSQFLAHLESLAERVEDVSAFRFVMRLTAAAAAIFIVATVQWSLRRAPASSPITAAAFSNTEKAIIDPESAIPVVASNAAVDPQMDFIMQGLSGGRP